MDVRVDDRHPLEAERGLRPAGRDRDPVEDAEAHRAVPQRVVAGRPAEREPTGSRRLDRAPAASRAASYVVSVAIVSPSSHARRRSTRSRRDVDGRVARARRRRLAAPARIAERHRSASIAPPALGVRARRVEPHRTRGALISSIAPSPSRPASRAEPELPSAAAAARPSRLGRAAREGASSRSSRSVGRGEARRAAARTAPRRAPPRACRTGSSEAAVFAPTPRAPGILSDGSPRSAMKSGTCSGSTS